MSCENCLLEGKFSFGQRQKIKHLSHILFTNWIGKLFLTINKPRSSKNSLCDTSSFLKVFLIEKFLEIDPLNGLIFFFDGYFSLVLLKGLFISSSKICATKE
jgi:hypothetical protein